MTTLLADWLVVHIRAAARDFFVHQNAQTISGAHPSTCSVGTGVLSRVIKVQGREVNHPPPSCAEVMNDWSCTSTVTVCLHDADRDIFTFAPPPPPPFSSSSSHRLSFMKCIEGGK